MNEKKRYQFKLDGWDVSLLLDAPPTEKDIERVRRMIDEHRTRAIYFIVMEIV